ncbi:MAG: tRNA (adenosine(37)-N6)-threonylcarbamoyltransferase complex dimerization subunit type 1 TsaB [Rikenellaceae bacterium]|nr:tRNA (adenosine(37)-N6)-threonylcarbamoyltransferase complex dimerization subunit type 1 TsaB [Rikenellaceae bacterium]
MAYILGIETGTDVCSVSLSRDGETAAVKESGGGNDHARTLAVLIDGILKENGIGPEKLGAVAVSGGPGSYTGLRIGVSTAKGLCYGAGIPLISVGSLYSLAAVAIEQQGPFTAGTILCPMIDARRMEVYARLYDHDLRPLSQTGAHIISSDSFAENISEYEKFLIFGSGAAKCREVLANPKVEYLDVRPSASGLVAAAWEKYRAGEFEDAAYFEPFYLKDFVVTASRKKFF